MSKPATAIQSPSQAGFLETTGGPPDAMIETSITELELIGLPSTREASLVFIYPRGAGLGTRYKLADRPVVIGREKDCDICVEDFSVSRRHAQIRPGPDGYYVEDLRSTNGTCVNDVVVTSQRLRDGDYLRTGDCIFRFLAGTNLETTYHEEIYRLAIVDALTGIHNKRHCLEFLERELARTARHGRTLSLVLFDIDHFKAVNDQHGHLAGDFVLRELAARVRPFIRADELFARYGGEEFAIILPETEQAAARELAERVRTLVGQEPFQFSGRTLHITISLGVASTAGGQSWTGPQLLAQADRNLYQAKHEGRNRVMA